MPLHAVGDEPLPSRLHQFASMPRFGDRTVAPQIPTDASDWASDDPVPRSTPGCTVLVHIHRTSDATPRPTADGQTGYAVDRFGSMPFADVLASLVRDVDLDTVAEAIHEFGLQAVAEHYLRALIDAGALHADAAGAYAEEDRILDADAHASPTVHPVTVADLADEFTRLDLTDPATSCR